MDPSSVLKTQPLRLSPSLLGGEKKDGLQPPDPSNSAASLQKFQARAHLHSKSRTSTHNAVLLPGCGSSALQEQYRRFASTINLHPVKPGAKLQGACWDFWFWKVFRARRGSLKPKTTTRILCPVEIFCNSTWLGVEPVSVC